MSDIKFTPVVGPLVLRDAQEGHAIQAYADQDGRERGAIQWHQPAHTGERLIMYINSFDFHGDHPDEPECECGERLLRECGNECARDVVAAPMPICPNPKGCFCDGTCMGQKSNGAIALLGVAQ